MAKSAKMIVSAAALMALICAAAPADADWWVICWNRKVGGVSVVGVKVYCNQCYSKRTQDFTPYATSPNCKVFFDQQEADEWYSKNCDCP